MLKKWILAHEKMDAGVYEEDGFVEAGSKSAVGSAVCACGVASAGVEIS